jgi:hypothetical protein
LIYQLQYGKDKTVNESKYEYELSGEECDANDLAGMIQVVLMRWNVRSWRLPSMCPMVLSIWTTTVSSFSLIQMKKS